MDDTGKKGPTAGQTRYVSCRLGGLNVEQAAEKARISVRTAYRWNKLPEVKEALREGAAALREQVEWLNAVVLARVKRELMRRTAAEEIQSISVRNLREIHQMAGGDRLQPTEKQREIPSVRLMLSLDKAGQREVRDNPYLRVTPASDAIDVDVAEAVEEEEG